MAFTFKLEHPDGTPAEKPTFRSSEPVSRNQHRPRTFGRPLV